MKKKLRDLLHTYKIDIFKFAHSREDIADLTNDCLEISEEVLKNAYHYHFHKLPDADRVEIINMINNYTIEAILPPVVEKIMRRIVILEHSQQATIDLLTEVLEALSADDTPGPTAGGTTGAAG